MRRKMKRTDVTEGGETFEIYCQYEEQWPPAHALIGESFEDQRAQGLLDESTYERVKVWQRVCGLTAMDAEKCSGCEHAMVELHKGQPVKLATYNDPVRRPPGAKPKTRR